jgi:GNAT superfamily N-acetyltransferase
VSRCGGAHAATGSKAHAVIHPFADAIFLGAIERVRTRALCIGVAEPRHFDGDWLEQATLRDGTPIVLRLVRSDDKELLREGFDRLSDESRYARFLSSKSTLTADELRYLTECDQEDHFALGAIMEAADGGAPIGLGIARFIRLPDSPAMAEAAIAVADDAQGKGLGRLLFLRLCAAAAERGIERFHCELLGSNIGMKSLLDQVIPERTVEAGGGVLSMELVLPHVTATEPATGAAPEGPMYRLFRAAAQNEWTNSVRRLWRR